SGSRDRRACRRGPPPRPGRTSACPPRPRRSATSRRAGSPPRPPPPARPRASVRRAPPRRRDRSMRILGERRAWRSQDTPMVGAPLHLRRELETRAERFARPSRWAPVPDEIDRAIAADEDLAKLARAVRVEMIPIIEKRLASLHVSPRLRDRFFRAWL